LIASVLESLGILLRVYASWQSIIVDGT